MNEFKKTTYLLRKQITKGYYAKITLEAKLSNKTIIEFNDIHSPFFKPAVEFAVKYVEEQILFSFKSDLKKNQIHVILHSIIRNDVDTTEGSVFYATVVALTEALNIDYVTIKPDFKNGELTIKF